MQKNNIDLKKIGTEARNKNTMDIDKKSTTEILELINNEDQTIAGAVRKAIPAISLLIDALVEKFYRGGRLIYLGAGTSGRIGLVDAVECHPTFSCPDEMVQCLMAGGKAAMVKAAEGTEDSPTESVEQLKKIGLNSKDFVIGITASGRTPYVISGVKYAKSIGCATGSVTTVRAGEVSSYVDFPIEAVTGAEPITGSTRMKSGTAQKMICNMITTTAMIKMGKVYSNLMIDVLPTNQKLVKRAEGILMSAAGVTEEVARAYIKKYVSVKKSLFAILSGIDDLDKVNSLLAKNHGNIHLALKEASDK